MKHSDLTLQTNILVSTCARLHFEEQWGGGSGDNGDGVTRAVSPLQLIHAGLGTLPLLNTQLTNDTWAYLPLVVMGVRLP